MESNEFLIMGVEYKRPRLSKNDIEADLKVTEGCRIVLMHDDENNHRIQIDVTLTAVILEKVSKKEELMLKLKTRSEYDVDKEPNEKDLDPYINEAVIEARKALKKITISFNIKPVDLVDNPVKFK